MSYAERVIGFHAVRVTSSGDQLRANRPWRRSCFSLDLGVRRMPSSSFEESLKSARDAGATGVLRLANACEIERCNEMDARD